MVHQSATDPNSLLHPTTKFHISQYVKHLAKQLNTSSSLNTSPEKLLETQKLWQSLTEGSETVQVPVVQLPPAIANPADPVSQPSSEKPLTEENVQKLFRTYCCVRRSNSSSSSNNKNPDRPKNVFPVGSQNPATKVTDHHSITFINKVLYDTFSALQRSSKPTLQRV